MQQALTFSLPLPSPPAPLKLAKKHLEATCCCSSHKAKSRPDMVVRTLVFKLVGIFVSELKKSGGNEYERKYTLKS